MILAGIILAAAAIEDGRYAIQTQVYGPEARGGACRAEVIIGSELIDYPHVEKADILLALTQEACNRYLPAASETALVIVDSLLVETVPETTAEVLKLPIVLTARNVIGRELATNIVALGALNSAAGLVSWPALEAAVRDRVPAGTFELNKKALEAGRKLAGSVRSQESGVRSQN
jgi:2-oxoglutarate ferredoxin oxidoreductase subunit gamma